MLLILKYKGSGLKVVTSLMTMLMFMAVVKAQKCLEGLYCVTIL